MKRFRGCEVLVAGQARRWSAYTPDDYGAHAHWPMLLFLHGIGERGDDGLAPTQVGIGPALQSWPERFPCLVVFPQCPVDRRWAAALDHIDAVLEAALRTFEVDEQRIALTGVSMGGFGAWLYGAAHADRFCAVMPICGGGQAGDARRLASVPIWAFHGAQDEVIDADESREMVEAVRQAGGTVRHTEYPDLGHNCWDRVYSDPEPISWLLAQTR